LKQVRRAFHHGAMQRRVYCKWADDRQHLIRRGI